MVYEKENEIHLDENVEEIEQIEFKGGETECL
jgi:hypothetical protein